MSESKNFIEEIIESELESGVVSHVVTRFPPEPNGYLHIGHAKALCIDFGMAQEYGGVCNLRFDDTNPTKEDVEYVDAIKYDINWLGFSWDKLCFGSEYFDTCYELAVKLIKKGVAYVDDLTKEEVREYRGTLTEPGRESPYRSRSVEENLALFERMRAGEFADGSCTLRAKIDMASPNINMRDPALYRILHMSHHHAGDRWCIYPMYDFAHPIQDALEGVTHSLCSLEYEAHRPLYNWVVEQCEFAHKPRQIEFARLNLTNTVMSKRYLRQLVESGTVDGWDDPRMPTLCGLRRRGYSAAAIKDFLARTGVAKADSEADTALLEHCIREELNISAERRMAVIDPLKVTISNWPAGKVEMLTAENNPNDESAGARQIPFSGEFYIERGDFMIDPPGKFFRLKPQGEVRLKYAYIIKCESCDVDGQGNVTQVYCTYDKDSKSGGATADRKVKGTLHWVDAATAVNATVRYYDSLLLPGDGDVTERANADSITVFENAAVEPELAAAQPGDKYQFLRTGYFVADTKDSKPNAPVFNRIAGLKDSYKG